MAINANESGTLKEIIGSTKQIYIKDCTGITCNNTITLPFLPEYTILLSTKTYGSTANASYPAAMLGISSTYTIVDKVPISFVSSLDMKLNWRNFDMSTLQMQLHHSSGYNDADRKMTFILIAIS